MKGGVRQFAHIKPDRFVDIQHSIGVLASEDFMAQLADLLRVQITPTDICGRFGRQRFFDPARARYRTRRRDVG